MDINIRHALIIALSLNKKTNDIINEIYLKNEKEYYEEYLESEFYDDYLKRTFTIEIEERVNKLIGIVEKCYKENNFFLIEKIIRKLNPSIVNFAKKSNSIDLNLFFDKYMKDRIDSIVEEEIFSTSVCLLYLGKIYNKKVTSNNLFVYIAKYWEGYKKSIMNEYNKFNLDIEDEISEEVGKRYKYFGLKPFEEIKEDNLMLFIENNIERETYAYLNKSGYKDIDFLSPSVFNEFRNKIFGINGINKVIGSYSRFVDTLGLNNLNIFNNIKFNNDILNMILKECYLAVKYNNLTKEEEFNYISCSIHVYGLVELYKEAKELYLNKSKEDKYKDLVKYEGLLKEEQEKICKSKKRLENSIEVKDNKIKELESKLKLLMEENRVLEKENKKIKDKLSDTLKEKEKLNLENNDMKKRIDNYNFSNNFNIKDEIPMENILDKINKYKIGIFGGIKSISDLSNVIKEVTFYDSLNKDISSIKKLDVLFINTDFFNHAFTKKVFSIASKYGIPVNYISGTNTDIILNRMYRVLD